MRAKIFLVVVFSLLLAKQAFAQDPMEGRLAGQAERTSQCAVDDWGYPCAWVNVESFTPAMIRIWQYGSWGPLTVHNPDSGGVTANLTNIAIPDYAAQGPWRSTGDTDLSAVFIDHAADPDQLCETWIFDWKWWTGPTAYWGGCMPLSNADGLTAFPWPYGSRASGMPFYNGVLTVKEWHAWLDRDEVPNHPLQVMVPLACRSFRPPANRSDGGNWAEPDSTDCIEYGTRYTLPADWTPLSRIWSPLVLLAVEMAKRGGLMVVDQTSYNVGIQVENPGRKYANSSVDGWDSPDGTVDPYGFGWDDRLMRQFPWSSLKVKPPHS
jgi:hypothetical protein